MMICGKFVVAAAIGVTAVASGALGQTFATSPSPSDGTRVQTHAGNLPSARGVSGEFVPVNMTGIQSWDLVGDTSNTVLLVDLNAALGRPAGAPVTMTSIGWDVGLSTVGDSWLSEIRVYFDDAVAPDLTGLFLRPGAGVNTPGTQAFSSGGQLDLSDAGIPNILLPNGILRMEIHETFDDVADAVDGMFDSGTFTVGVQVPAPASLALVSIGGVCLGRRRRRA